MAEVLSSPSPHDGHSYLSTSSPLLRQSSSQSLFLGPPLHPVSRSPSPSSREGSSSEPVSRASSSISSSPPKDESPVISTSSFHSTPPSSLSLDTNNTTHEEDDNFLPTYDDNAFIKDDGQLPPPGTPDDSATNSASTTPEENDTDLSESDPESILNPVADDIAVREEPTKQVDYLSHDWREEDIWSSWKHIVSRRKVYGERSRLENASWRTWAKQKHKLKTVSPETLNWLKDCDVTWLYGPLQEGSWHKHSSEPASRLSKSNSFVGNKKPILKKRTVSEEMLQKSLSSSSLIKQAAAAVQAQRKSNPKTLPDERNRLRRTASDFIGSIMPPEPINTGEVSYEMPSTESSGLQTPDHQARRHIRFDNKVEQCIAVDFKEGSQESESNIDWSAACSDSEDEDDLPMLKTKSKRLTSTPSSSRNSFSGESKGIAMLPSTTIKFHHDESNSLCSPGPQLLRSPWKSGTLSNSSSQETLRPSDPTANFLLPQDECDEADIEWEPSGAFGSARHDGLANAQGGQFDHAPGHLDDQEHCARGLRRTPSGMFMPFDEGDEDSLGANGILGRVTDTVNTVKDIATVIWNVGWHK